MFKGPAFTPRANHVYPIIVDALDECPPRAKVLNLIEGAYRIKTRNAYAQIRNFRFESVHMRYEPTGFGHQGHPRSLNFPLCFPG